MQEYLSEDQAKKEQSDEEVLQLSISRPSLFAILVRKYEDAFMRKARSIVHDEEAAEDIVQETFHQDLPQRSQV
jgi:DNA-directed RNA polymerase specialized sigma24 family protein